MCVRDAPQKHVACHWPQCCGIATEFTSCSHDSHFPTTAGITHQSDFKTILISVRWRTAPNAPPKSLQSQVQNLSTKSAIHQQGRPLRSLLLHAIAGVLAAFQQGLARHAWSHADVGTGSPPALVHMRSRESRSTWLPASGSAW